MGSLRTGPYAIIRAAGAIANTNKTAMTTFLAGGNKTNVIITTTTGGCGSLTFTAETSADTEDTYADVIDRDSVWSQVCTTPDTAGTYVLALEGLKTVPGDWVRLSFQAGTAAGGLEVIAFNWDDPAGGGVAVSVGDVVVDVDAIQVSTAILDDWDAVHDAAIGTDGCVQMLESKTFDGNALTAVSHEGDAVRTAASKEGVTYTSTVNADGSKMQPVGDAVGTSIYTAIGDAITTAVVETAGTKKALNVNVTDGTNDMPTGDDPARAISCSLTDGTDTADIVDEGDDISSADNGVIVYGKERAGDTAQTLEFNASDDLYVDINAFSVGVIDVQGDDAHDDTFDANPLGIGVEAETLGAISTVTAAGDITRLKGSTSGILHAALTDPTGADDVGTAIRTALEIIDDWDESDRAKVNPIAGQAGVAAGSGAVDALTQRCILATDDPAVTLLGTIDGDTSTIAGDTTSIDGKTPALGNAAMAAAVPVTLASDDTNTVDIPNVIGTDGAAGPTKALSVGGTQSSGELEELRVDSDGHLQIDVLTSTGIGATPSVTNATGAGAIATTTSVSANWELNHVSIHFSGPVVAAESVVVSIDANDGAAYDVPMDSTVVTGETDYIYIPPVGPVLLESGDEIKVAMAGSDGLTFGLRIVGKLV